MSTIGLNSTARDEGSATHPLIEFSEINNKPAIRVVSRRGRLTIEFGDDHQFSCRVICNDVAISGSARVFEGPIGDNNLAVSIKQGVVTEEVVAFDPEEVGVLKLRGIQKDGHYDFLVDLPKEEIKARLEEAGVSVSRAEEGALSHKSSYVIRVPGDSETKVTVHSSKDRTLVSRGDATVLANRGHIFVETKQEGVSFIVDINIS